MTLRKGTNMLMRGFGFSFMLFILMSPFGAQSFAQFFFPPYVTEYHSEFEVQVLKEINGVLTPGTVKIQLNPDPIGDPYAFSWGTARTVGGDDRNKANCSGKKYDYAEIDISMNWFAMHPILGLVDQSHNKAHWDAYYLDYDQPESCDYSQNCHGYAFDVGDWPATAGLILNANPMSDEGPPCYQWSSEKDATVASYPIAHTIKVVGTECDPVALPIGGVGCSGNIKPNIRINLDSSKLYCAAMLPLWVTSVIWEQDPIPGDPVIVKDQKIVHTSEQFRESGTYTQTSSCEAVEALDINLAHKRAGVVTPNLVTGQPTQGYAFTLYRPYQGE